MSKRSTEAGRVLAKRNEKRLRDASGLIGDVLTEVSEGTCGDEKKTEAFPGGRTADEMRALLSDGVCDLMGDGCSCWVLDWSDEWVAFNCYERHGDYELCTMKVDYVMADDGVITWGTPIEVERRTSYDPVPPEPDEPAMETRTAESIDRFTGRVVAALPAIDGRRQYRMRLIQAGESLNGRIYPAAVLSAAAPLYEGAKVFSYHRTSAEISQGVTAGIVGQIRNVAATSDALEGDLVLLPSAVHTAELLDASLEAQADGLPPLAGMSHDVYASFRTVTTTGGQRQEATQITKVNSVDVVSDPAAGGAALRAVAGIGDPDHRNTPETTEDPMPKPLTEMIREALGTASPEEKAAAAALLGGGTPTPTTETAGYAKTSLVGRMVIDKAAESAKLTPKAAAVLADRLPATFTETDLANAVESLNAVREAYELDGLTPKVGGAAVTADTIDKQQEALDLLVSGGPKSADGYRSLRHAYLDICGAPRGQDPYGYDFAKTVLREAAGFDSTGRVSESVTSATFSAMLGDSITRRMIAVYNLGYLQDWRKLVSDVLPVNDFRTQRRTRVGGYGNLPVVDQGSPYQPLTTPSDEQVTYVPSKRGGTEDLTLETILNDDVGALRQIPVLLGEAAAATLYELVFDYFVSNPNVYDSSALFVAGHNNTASNALSQTNLSTGRAAMRKQTRFGNGSRKLNFVPAFLVVGPDLEELAFQLCTSAVAIPATPAGPSNTPNIHQGLVPLVSPYITSSTAWYLVADPAMAKTIEVGFVNGQENPELFTMQDPSSPSHFAADKVTYKIRHMYGTAVLDYRGFYRGNS